MGRIIAVTGFAGAGKSTAIDFLELAGIGPRIYVGQFVIEALDRKRLTRSPENEKTVRAKLREEHGPAYLAILAWPSIQTIVASEGTALLDAVMSPDELAFYRTRTETEIDLIAITASFEIRMERLAQRQSRPLDRDQLSKRDEYERSQLRIIEVISAAAKKIVNEGSLQELDQNIIAAFRA